MKMISLFLFLFCLTGAPSSVHDFTMDNIDGQPVALSAYKGKVLLIVNTASRCGLTPQYKELQAVYEQYEKQGLVVLGFPANNFMGQEPGTNVTIKQFCKDKYAVTFPMFSKISVKGKDMHPLYQYLTDKEQNGKVAAPVTWNFQKFLVDRDGKVVAAIAPKDKVTDAKVVRLIEKTLKR
jgi:glutathione peroxidase